MAETSTDQSRMQGPHSTSTCTTSSNSMSPTKRPLSMTTSLVTEYPLPRGRGSTSTVHHQMRKDPFESYLNEHDEDNTRI
ncbi:hypothetical protein OC845_006975, partial [Tilletia horrida]